MDEFEKWYAKDDSDKDSDEIMLRLWCQSAFKAGREAGMREAAAIVGTLAERPYDSMPEFAAITHAESAILAAIGEGK